MDRCNELCTKEVAGYCGLPLGRRGMACPPQIKVLPYNSNL